LIGEQARVAKKVPEQFLERATEQQQARETLLRNAFGDESTVAAMEATRTARTMPLKEQALRYADVYGEQAPKLVEAIDNATKELKKLAPNAEFGFGSKYQRELYDVVAKNKAFKEVQLKSLSESGFFPLSSGSLITRLEEETAKVGQRSNDLLVDGAKALQSKLAKLTDENGIIKSQDLYNVRKNIGEDLRAILQSKGNPSFSSEAYAVEKQLRGLIDASINKASGSNLWAQYIKNFSTYSTKIDRLKAGQEIMDRLKPTSGDKERIGVFAEALNNFALLAKQVTGTSRYQKPEDLFTSRQNAAINKVYADLQRKVKAKEVLGDIGQGKGVDFEATKELPTGMLSTTVTVAKSILATLKRGSQKEFDQKMADLLLEPQKLADFISQIPKSEAQGIVGAIMSRTSPEIQKTLRQALYYTPGQTLNQMDDSSSPRTTPKLPASGSTRSSGEMFALDGVDIPVDSLGVVTGRQWGSEPQQTTWSKQKQGGGNPDWKQLFPSEADAIRYMR
jgi:hypothetical protein